MTKTAYYIFISRKKLIGLVIAIFFSTSTYDNEKTEII